MRAEVKDTSGKETFDGAPGTSSKVLTDTAGLLGSPSPSLVYAKTYHFCFLMYCFQEESNKIIPAHDTPHTFVAQ